MSVSLTAPCLLPTGRCSPPPRGALSRHAPRIRTFVIPDEKVSMGCVPMPKDACPGGLPSLRFLGSTALCLCRGSQLARIPAAPFPPTQVGLVIGPGGKTVQGIEKATGADVTVSGPMPLCLVQQQHLRALPERALSRVGAAAHPSCRAAEPPAPAPLQIDSATCTVYIKAASEEVLHKAEASVLALIEDPVVGRVYRGARVTSIQAFGAFVEVRALLLPEPPCPAPPPPRCSVPRRLSAP